MTFEDEGADAILHDIDPSFSKAHTTHAFNDVFSLEHQEQMQSTIHSQPFAVQAQPSSVQAQLSTVHAQPATVQAQPSTVQAQPSTVLAEQSVVQVLPSTVQAQPSTVQPQQSLSQPATIQSHLSAVQPQQSLPQLSTFQSQQPQSTVRSQRSQSQQSQARDAPIQSQHSLSQEPSVKSQQSMLKSSLVHVKQQWTPAERLGQNCESVFAATCAALEAAYLRRIEKERLAHEAAWAATSARVASELRADITRAREALEARLAAFRAVHFSEPKPHIEYSDAARELEAAQLELEMLHETVGPTVKAQRDAQQLLVQAREAAVEASRRKPEAVPIKVMGVLDPAVLTSTGMTAEEISILQERLRHPDFYPLKVVAQPDNTVVEEFDRSHPELVALDFEFGPVAVDEVLRCFKELSDWNPSSRTSLEVPWDIDTDTALRPADVIRRLAHHRPRTSSTRTSSRYRRHVESAETAEDLSRVAPTRNHQRVTEHQPPRPFTRPAPTAAFSRVFLYPDQHQRPSTSPPSSWVNRTNRSFASYFFGSQQQQPQQPQQQNTATEPASRSTSAAH